MRSPPLQMGHDPLPILGIEVQGAVAAQLRQLQAQPLQAPAGAGAGLPVVHLGQQVLRRTDLPLEEQLGRQETGVLEEAVARAQMLGHETVVVQRQGTSGAGQTFEGPLFLGFTDAGLRQAVDQPHARSSTLGWPDYTRAQRERTQYTAR